MKSRDDQRPTQDAILARWTVPPARLRAFTAQVRARSANSPFPPKDLLAACDAHVEKGLEVVFRTDELVVGSWSLSFTYNQVTDFRLEDAWLLVELEGTHTIPVPTAPESRAAVERGLAAYARLVAEENRRYFAARAAPTLSNRLLNIAEAHFAWVVLGFFFVGIPLLVALFGLLRGGFE